MIQGTSKQACKKCTDIKNSSGTLKTQCIYPGKRQILCVNGPPGVYSLKILR